MLCDVCKKHEAKVHIQEIIDDIKTSVHLCTDCAAANGMLKKDHAMLDLSAMVCKITASTLGQGADPDGVCAGPAEPTLTCPVCGLTDLEFTRVRRFGCVACYDTFAEILAPILREIHRGETHRGLLADAHVQSGGPNLVEELTFLRRELDRAVASEAYEQAADLRDRIHRITAVDEKGIGVA